MNSLNVRIDGRVQGVAFREYTRRNAVRFGIAGWVRNTNDGSVEALIQGDDEALQAMLAWFNSGSPFSQVVSVSWHEVATSESFADFSIRF